MDPVTGNHHGFFHNSKSDALLQEVDPVSQDEPKDKCKTEAGTIFDNDETFDRSSCHFDDAVSKGTAKVAPVEYITTDVMYLTSNELKKGVTKQTVRKVFSEFFTHLMQGQHAIESFALKHRDVTIHVTEVDAVERAVCVTFQLRSQAREIDVKDVLFGAGWRETDPESNFFTELETYLREKLGKNKLQLMQQLPWLNEYLNECKKVLEAAGHHFNKREAEQVALELIEKSDKEQLVQRFLKELSVHLSTASTWCQEANQRRDVKGQCSLLQTVKSLVLAGQNAVTPSVITAKKGKNLDDVPPIHIGASFTSETAARAKIINPGGDHQAHKGHAKLFLKHVVPLCQNLFKGKINKRDKPVLVKKGDNHILANPPKTKEEQEKHFAANPDDRKLCERTVKTKFSTPEMMMEMYHKLRELSESEEFTVEYFHIQRLKSKNGLILLLTFLEEEKQKGLEWCQNCTAVKWSSIHINGQFVLLFKEKSVLVFEDASFKLGKTLEPRSQSEEQKNSKCQLKYLQEDCLRVWTFLRGSLPTKKSKAKGQRRKTKKQRKQQQTRRKQKSKSNTCGHQVSVEASVSSATQQQQFSSSQTDESSSLSPTSGATRFVPLQSFVVPQQPVPAFGNQQFPYQAIDMSSLQTLPAFGNQQAPFQAVDMSSLQAGPSVPQQSLPAFGNQQASFQAVDMSSQQAVPAVPQQHVPAFGNQQALFQAADMSSQQPGPAVPQQPVPAFGNQQVPFQAVDMSSLQPVPVLQVMQNYMPTLAPTTVNPYFPLIAQVQHPVVSGMPVQFVPQPQFMNASALPMVNTQLSCF